MVPNKINGPRGGGVQRSAGWALDPDVGGDAVLSFLPVHRGIRAVAVVAHAGHKLMLPVSVLLRQCIVDHWLVHKGLQGQGGVVTRHIEHLVC